MAWHGIGDTICLTPQLRHLYEHNYEVDVLVRPYVIKSRLLEHCPYVNAVIPLPSDRGPFSKSAKRDGITEMFKGIFDELSVNYDYSVKSLPNFSRKFYFPGGKIHCDAKNFFGPDRIPLEKPTNLDLEVFISEQAEAAALEYIENSYPSGYIFSHTNPRFHGGHKWNPEEWIKANIGGSLPSFKPNTMSFSEDVNIAFVMAREAKHVILSSSVFVHACDALGVVMDAVYYGAPSLQHYPIDRSKIKNVILGY